jgi:hypothetical protein
MPVRCDGFMAHRRDSHTTLHRASHDSCEHFKSAWNAAYGVSGVYRDSDAKDTGEIEK